MGAVNEPTQEQAEVLEAHRERLLCVAADALNEADMFLLCVGAGFSADSGLAVYKDVASFPAYHERDLEYVDLCNPEWMINDPDTFYGFWGKCFNDYRQTAPHEGYEIIKKWKSKFAPTEDLTDTSHFPNLFVQTDKGPLHGAFFIYSSNVDGHFQKVGYSPNEIYEIHGSCENWQCSRCCSDVWKAPEGYAFEVDSDTMLAHPDDNTSLQGTPHENAPGWTTNHPTCPTCGELARPNVLMFGDCDWISDDEAGSRYSAWLARAKELSSEGKKLVIIEIGCGNNVPSVRMASENCLRNMAPDTTTLVRINPDFPFVSSRVQQTTLPILGKGLESLRKIDLYLNTENRPTISNEDLPLFIL